MPLFVSVIGIMGTGGLLSAYLAFASPSTPPPAATPTPTDPAPRVTFDSSSMYAFPVAADPLLYEWTHTHWNGINAVDIEARFDLPYPNFVQATSATLVAVTNGLVMDYSGSIGGQGYMLQGDDGLDYYYAHMADQWVPDGEHVTVGQPLGIMGNTGDTAQFIEPHLHLAIGPRDTLWNAQPGVNAAEWLKIHFNLDWQDRPQTPITYAVPQGAPVHHPDLTIVTRYEDAVSRGLAQPAIEFGFSGPAPDSPQPVSATLSGEVNVIRWTAHYGTRIQINNPASGATVVISGVDDWLVRDGERVSQGDTIGHWNPTHRPRLHYMIFQNSVIIDPSQSIVAY